MQATAGVIEASVYENVHGYPGLSDSILEGSGDKGLLYVITYNP